MQSSRSDTVLSAGQRKDAGGKQPAAQADSVSQKARRQDRRDATAPRLAYEALVEVGADAAGGFEAESLDVSLDGMRMRTAYLPEIGQTLMCRFDGFGGEIMAEAEVVWCKQEGRGGEFGIRFVGLDAHALTLLQDLCSPRQAEVPAEPASQPTGAPPGTRVRLHIEGLGSPMRARVRDAAQGEVLIGSNLEFLKVGRDVELEDLDHGKRRVALIEHVAVEIDRATNIPQLVVALSYRPAAGQAEEEHSTAPYRVKTRDGAPAESTPEPTVIDKDGKPHVETGGRMAHMPPARAVAAADEVDEDDDHDGERDEAEAHDDAAPGARQRATQRVEAFAKKLGPSILSAGQGARGALGKVWSTVRERHAERRAERAKARAPKRTTAPPPSGALRSDGRRLRRDAPAAPAVEDHTPESSAVVESVEQPKSTRRRTLVSGVLAATAVVGIYFASTQLKGRFGADDEPATPAAAAPANAAPGTPGADGIATANVPLFGATPLSTTEPVPAPPPPGEAAADEPGAAGADDAADSEGDSPVAAGDKEWGVGDVVNPTVFRIKMDGMVGGISGAETATGFTITIPGRKSVNSTAGLAAKDKRLESVNVVNYPDRAEVTLQFKKDVPAFMARATGKALEISIATPKKGHKADDDEDKPAPKKKGKKKPKPQ